MIDFMDSLYLGFQNYFYRMKERVKDDSGMGTVEVILIIVVLVGLVIIFKTQLTNIINSLFEKITSQADSV